MFKKLKDKLAEEVKSSPQRIQQFAQAAQAAVTSASSSISDITNNDLFSIGDNEGSQQNANKLPTNKSNQEPFRSVSLMSASPQQPTQDGREQPGSYLMDNQRQRRLSNSSFTSDVSFKLPSYESPSMYHLQSDMDVSASEAEDRGFASPGGGPASLERVTKEQLYSAYRRTQERYTKYRTQYADLARHYKLLERENAKARSVLVETQDKALRRISELREQCSLEQSAKAHLEQALREEIDEKNMNIEALNTKVQLLQNKGSEESSPKQENTAIETEKQEEVVGQLINITDDKEDDVPQETNALNIKIEKMEQLINKYKESVKGLKDKNSQLTIEIETLSSELKTKAKDSEKINALNEQLSHAHDEIKNLKENNEVIQNKLNSYDFNKTKEITTLEVDLQRAQEEIEELQSKISAYSKSEEDYAISLAENKLSVHKELEGKESEIKTLKDTLAKDKQEIQSLNIILNDYKQQITSLDEDKATLNAKINELNMFKTVVTKLESEVAEYKQRFSNAEQAKILSDQENKCLLLQIKQEVAEKLAIVDRNSYLEDRNKHLTEDNLGKNEKIRSLENEMQSNVAQLEQIESENINEWKEKCYRLETEINEEREELITLQTEIEKMMENHNFIQLENKKLHKLVKDLQHENEEIKHVPSEQSKTNLLKTNISIIQTNVNELRKCQAEILSDVQSTFTQHNECITSIQSDFSKTLTSISKQITQFTKEIDCLKKERKCVELNLKQTKSQLESVTHEKNKNNEKILQLQEQLAISDTLVARTTNDCKEQTNRFKKLTEEKDDILKSLEILRNEYTALLTIKDEVDYNLNEITKSSSVLVEENNHKQKEIDRLESAINLKDSKIYALEESLTNQSEDSNEINELKKNINELKATNNSLTEAKTALSDKNQVIQSELKEMKDQLEKSRERYAAVEMDKSSLINEIRDLTNKEKADEMQTHLKSVEEIELLKSKCEQIKQEKESLYENLKSVERKVAESESQHKKEYEDLKSQFVDIEQEKESLKQQIESLTNDNSALRQLQDENKINLNKIVMLQEEYDTLKQDNQRLQSDIEGLQSYLAKISKENGSLNDKLRDKIASGENIDSGNDLQNEIKKLNEEVLSEKSKVDDLIRENNLLVEENYELKDQIKSQNFTANLPSTEPKESERKQSELSSKVNNLEQINNSALVNIKELKEANQKLRTSNQKLEIRLDEALVSLRHLHSLQEHTELEYLKNILFEYLTGSGEHSITLAKVVAAVVKFDDNQTAAIIKREKERHGLLRQLGLL